MSRALSVALPGHGAPTLLLPAKEVNQLEVLELLRACFGRPRGPYSGRCGQAPSDSTSFGQRPSAGKTMTFAPVIAKGCSTFRCGWAISMAYPGKSCQRVR